MQQQKQQSACEHDQCGRMSEQRPDWECYRTKQQQAGQGFGPQSRQGRNAR